jgi:hypothetical protein
MLRSVAEPEGAMTTKLLEATAEPEPLEHSSPEPRAHFPPAVMAILEAPEAVEVVALKPTLTDDFDTSERPGFLFGHRVRGSVRVPTAARQIAVARAVIEANRTRNGWALCFDPHYAVRVSRGTETVVLLFCFWCGNVRVVGRGTDDGTYLLGKSAERVLRKELRRGGVGLLWFWRCWLPW